jgi:DNA-nicking Smr family endonuclease
MSRAKRGLSAEERELWERIRRSVKPITRDEPLEEWLEHPTSPPAVRDAPPEPARPKFPATPVAPFLPAYSPPVSAPKSQGHAPIDDRTVRKLRRGKLEIDARIDLHGMTERQAHDALLMFLRNASAAGARIILVITGKGRMSDGVLRRAVPLWFAEQPFHLLVGGHRAAHVDHGGDGALYVRLRREKSRDRDQ